MNAKAGTLDKLHAVSSRSPGHLWQVWEEGRAYKRRKLVSRAWLYILRVS